MRQIYYINLNQLGLICQIHNLDHEIIITPKKIKTNYKTQFPINLMLKYEIKKKTNWSQLKLTHQIYNLIIKSK